MGTPSLTGRKTDLNEACPRRAPAFPAWKSLQSPPVEPPVEQFAVRDQVSHDKYGLGRVVLVEDAVIVVFGSHKIRILSPFAKLTRL